MGNQVMNKSNTINFDPLLKILSENKHHELSDKVIDLYEKWQKKEVTIGFTGHFSAGKSSMVNALLGETILPSSPIPTSANIVEIRAGEDKAVYQLNDGTYTEDDHVNEQRIKQLSKNGDIVQSVQIYKQNDFLRDQVTIMDTPGIDSSDDAEFDRTLNQIHLIDLFIYVMDYNHVLSEVNFRFLKELERREVPYMIVINQIDKHREKELLFDSYKQRLRVSYEEWSLYPEAMFFTSLKDTESPLNQFYVFKDTLQQRMVELPNQLDSKIKRELDLIIEQWESDHSGNTGQEQLLNRLELIEEQKENIQHKMNTVKQSLQKELDAILSNAYLMTFETRELAKEYLYSQQQNFKVGGLFAKKKTEAEKRERTDQFLHQLNNRIQSEMVWAVRSHLEKNVRELTNEKELLQQVQEISFQADQELIESNVNPSAQVTGDYVLIYTKALHQSIQQQSIQKFLPLIESISEKKSSEFHRQLDELVQEQNSIRAETNQDFVKEIKQVVTQLRSQLFEPNDTQQANEETNKAWQEKVSHRKKKSLEKLVQAADDHQLDETITPTEPFMQEISNQSLDYTQIESDTKAIIHQAEQLPIIDQLTTKLKARFKQVQEKEYTVALFGAFSAGKSSFANVMLGNSLLPVSPNPTTAAINKIRPVSNDHEHGKVIVRFKSDEMLQEQLQQILEPYTRKKFTSIPEITKYLKKEWDTLRTYFERTEASFIDAYLKGIQQAKTWLSQTKEETLNTFSDYVTKEHISCFVQEVEIFYDCALTQEGITLVDTPGADSIHARHTNVSLQYIRQADVILYVNYYNHAFSRADREFLRQLGRLSQTITAGKMFFVLNAADLADSEQELNDVKNYLKSQLKQYGIGQPAIFPISSKELLTEQPAEFAVQQLDQLQTVFYQFMDLGAKGIVFQNLIGELTHLQQFIAQTIREASLTESEKQKTLSRGLEERNELESKLASFDVGVLENQLTQEATELTHYLAERIDIQSIEWLKATINPAVIQSNGKKGKEELASALQQTVQFIRQKLTKEWYEIDILLDDQMNRIKNQLIDEFNEFIEESFPQEKLFFETENYTGTELPTFSFQMTDDEKKSFLKYFKNKKDFFEHGSRSELFEEITRWIGNKKTEVIQQFDDALHISFVKKLHATKKQLMDETLENIDLERKHKQLIFESQEVISSLEQLQTNLNEVLAAHRSV
ncbi:dynamin family protein [Allobacillus sp. GCM10007491]|uniref:Dynamin family protein n=1 Tax=Allobacillus saliphilus TaxID=2912308 RepID=A0A941HS99_9BACI|nr:dynamin family protein [Allobacillus saliphilus]MBR7553193.1 dynamin family protein [Allobacillus saliphilus]